jgi:photosystem II stability/assembly factor-like uncharacterized protein
MSKKTFLLGVMLLLSAFSMGLAQDGQWQKISNPYAIGRIDEIAVAHEGSTRYIFLADSSANGTIWRSSDDGLSWERNHDQTGYYHRRVVMEPSNANGLNGWTLLRAAESSDEFAGPWKTNNSGNSWVQPANNNLTTKNLYALDAVNSSTNMNTAFIGGVGLQSYGYDKLFKTTDGGANWLLKQSGFTTGEVGIVWDICVCQACPESVLAAYQGPTSNSLSNGIYRTINGGTQWYQFDFDPDNENASAKTVEIDPSDPNVAYVTELSPDPGKIIKITYPWAAIPILEYIVNYGPCQSISIDDENYAYFAFYEGGNWAGSYYTGFSSLPLGGSFIGDRLAFSIAVDPLDHDVICVGGSSMFYISSDRGETFDERVFGTNPLSTARLDVDLQNDPPVFCTQSGAMLFRTIDLGQTWILQDQNQNPGGVIRQWYDENRWLAGSNDNGESYPGMGMLRRSFQDGAYWASVGEWVDARDAVYCLASDATAPVIYAAGAGLQSESGEFHFSTDDGANWVHTTVNNNTNILGIDLRPSDLGQAIDTVIVADAVLGIYRSADFGQNWTAINSSLTNTHTTRVKYCQGQPKIALAGTGEGMFKSANMSAATPTWSQANYGIPTFSAGSSVADLEFNPVDNSIIYLSVDDYGTNRVFLSADTARSWISMATGLDGYLPHDFAVDPTFSDTFYAATDDGVYKLKNPVVHGALASDQTWGPGLVVVSGDVTVPSGITLTIAAPCTLLFVYNFDIIPSGASTSKAELIIQGKLRAIGSSNDWIVFMSSDPIAPEKGDWYAIRADSGSIDSLDYCIIKHAEYGIKAYKPSVFVVEHSTIEENTTAGISGQYLPSEAKIRYTRFENCGTYGLNLFKNSPTAEYDTLLNNRYGIYYSGNESPVFQNCKIAFTATPNNSYWGISASKYSSGANPYPQVLADTIYGFEQGGISFNGVSSSGQIYNCKVISSGVTGIRLSSSSPTISGAQNEGNLIYSSTYGLGATSSSYPIIRWTKFSENNSIGVHVDAGSNANLGTLTVGGEGNNSFVRKNANQFYYHASNANATYVDAYNNYWSPKDAQYFYHINYTPYLSTDPLPKKEVSGSPQLAEDLEIASVYPNPFNPTATISFNLNSPQMVSVNVYNIMGQMIRNLSDGYHEAGIISLIWDGKDKEGRPVSSGTYFCSIQAETKQQTVKMTMLK